MQHFLKIAEGVDVMPLLLAIQRRPDLWKEDTYLRDYPQGPFGEIETIMLRFPVKGVYETQEEVRNHLLTHDPHESIDYPPYRVLHEARPLVMSLMARVAGERLGRVMVNKIAPGGHIFPHADTKEHAEYYSRFHIVIKSRPGNVFRCESEQVHMQPGEVWWFNNALEHEVTNNSDDDRIHVVVDIRTSR
ncbi:aspartyl/asparaginyl beta-hydroxylase domain-containing protein [Burkholderia stagnalis]|uniref:aspartyl/asparaginyl beta-hydroxylase domain-containing protein n=1 Tax=Burkholderia stagnalis TaxID=1503054 RepID=UPI00325A48E5